MSCCPPVKKFVNALPLFGRTILRGASSFSCRFISVPEECAAYGSAEIGGTVRNRVKYVIPAFIISIILYFIFGGAVGSLRIGTAVAETLVASHQNPAGLLMLIPTVIVIGMAVKGHNLFVTLPVGIIVATGVGLIAGLFGFNDLFSIQNGIVSGAFPAGVAGMLNVCILLMVIVSMGDLLISSGYHGRTC